MTDSEDQREQARVANLPTVKHLCVVVSITSRSRSTALTALKEATATGKVSESRVEQLRCIANDLEVEVARLEVAMSEAIVREDDPVVDRVDELRADRLEREKREDEWIDGLVHRDKDGLLDDR